MRLKRVTWQMVFVLAAGAVAACNSAGGSRPDDQIGKTGLRLTVGPTSGATAIHFVITPVDCTSGAGLGGAVVDITKPLDDLTVPDSIPELGNRPLDVGSTHAFADDFEVLPAGCYDVSTQPMNMAIPSCHEAHQKGVVVNAGKTTEVFLINQCDGMDPGAIDALSALNHPPVLLTVNFKTSKFVAECSDQNVCATAYDPDKDPVRFQWKVTGGPPVDGPFDVSSVTNPDGSTTECVRFIPRKPGKATVTVTIFDILHNNDSMLTAETFEKWLADHGYPAPSRATLEFPFFSAGAPGPLAPESGDQCGDGLDNDCDGAVDSADSDCGIPPEGCAPGTKPICEDALDVVLLEDLTGSFFDDLATVNTFSGTLANDLLAANSGNRFGVASFKDKPFGFFGSPGDYVYKLHLPLTNVVGDFVSTIAGLTAGGGFDGPEAQIEALNLAAQDGAIGFGAGSVKHFVVLATDAPPHVAPDCVAAGLCSMDNNNDGVADSNEDYPSIAQLVSTLSARGVQPVFAVASGFESSYQPIVDMLGKGRVVTLSTDSSNLKNAIFSGLPCHCGAP